MRYSAGGHPYTTWVPYGMPRIPDAWLECVFYLYPTREAAERGEHAGGTGFVAGVKSTTVDGRYYGYGISCKHVVHELGCSVARVNCHDGGVEIFEFEPHEWISHPAGEDLAAVPLVVSPERHKLRLIGEELFITKEAIQQNAIGPGDEVFMIGRFVRHDGRETNAPSVRFGNLSIMPMNMRNPSTGETMSFAVEMRSMAGYSGSPVFVYQTPWDLRSGNMTIGGVEVMLLGIDWGHIVSEAEVKERITVSQVAALQPGEREVRYVLVNTGMNGVVPAWTLSEFLHGPPFAAHHAYMDARAAPEKERGGFQVDAAPSAEHEHDLRRDNALKRALGMPPKRRSRRDA